MQVNEEKNQTLEKTINYESPEKHLAHWKSFLNTKPDLEKFCKEVMKFSMKLHSNKYIGHQLSPCAPVSAASATLASLLNNGTGVYEMAMPSVCLEKIISEEFCRRLGFLDGCGFLTSGGTLANLTALLTARNQLKGDTWNQGTSNRKLAVIVSEQAHYCIDKAAKIMGLGQELSLIHI